MVHSITSPAMGGLNRTIQELKRVYSEYMTGIFQFESHHIGIETFFSPFTLPSSSRLNRTIQELKLKKELLNYRRSRRLNRTIQELKLPKQYNIYFSPNSLNRTIQELKLHRRCC